MKWDDMKFVLAVARGDTLSAAARRLGVDQTTVTRRISALEKAFGAKLFFRLDGRLAATELGELAIARAERIEAEIDSLHEAATGADKTPEGHVRITTVPMLANHLLIPRLGAFLDRLPGLTLEIIAEPRNLNLSKRDADVALRLARPLAGSALCRRIGALSYSIYGPAGVDSAALPWITYEEAYAHLPQARWVARNARSTESMRVKVNDGDGLLAAVRARLGRAVLPDLLVSTDVRLERLSNKPVLSREVWLLVYPDVRHLPRVGAVIDWLSDLIGNGDLGVRS